MKIVSSFSGLGSLKSDNLVIIPTHNHPYTLGFAVESAQNQDIPDANIVVIGDGVNDDTRDVLSRYIRDDDRVIFIDMPKAIRHGEEYRDAVIRKSRAKLVTYLGDDDLFFPHHLSTMKSQLEGVDFVNPLPIFINIGGQINYVATDLANPESRAWHLDPHLRRNSVSLTGATHTRSSYLRLPSGWRPAPIGRWTDHYMWEQYFSLDGFTAKTSSLSTTAKFNDGERKSLSGVQRSSEVGDFLKKMTADSFIQAWNMRVADRVRQHSVEVQLTLDVLSEQNAEISEALYSMRRTFSWRVTRPLRAVRSLQRTLISRALRSAK
jgi:glycosyltransferase involved in cell wall biosynthesis